MELKSNQDIQDSQIKDFLFNGLTQEQKDILRTYIPTHSDQSIKDKFIPKIELISGMIG